MSCLSLPNFLSALSQIHIHCTSAAVLETVVLRGTKGELLCSFPWGAGGALGGGCSEIQCQVMTGGKR